MFPAYTCCPEGLQPWAQAWLLASGQWERPRSQHRDDGAGAGQRRWLGCPRECRFHVRRRPHTRTLGLLPKGRGPSKPQVSPLEPLLVWPREAPSFLGGCTAALGPSQDLLLPPHLLTLPLALNREDSPAGAGSELFLMKFLREKSIAHHYFSPNLNTPQCRLVANVNISEIQSAGCLPGIQAFYKATVNPNCNKQHTPILPSCGRNMRGEGRAPQTAVGSREQDQPKEATWPHLRTLAGSVGRGCV